MDENTGGIFKKISGGVNKAVKSVKNWKRVLRFIFTTPIKWILLAILVVILLYFLSQITPSTLFQVFGIEDAGIKNTADYAILQQLTNSGYNDLMPSDELARYLNYEYAVMMDAARFFSETGVVEHKHNDTANAIDIDRLTSNEAYKEDASKLFDLTQKGEKSEEYKELISSVRKRQEAESKIEDLETKKKYADEYIKKCEDDIKSLETLKSKSGKSEEDKKAYESKLSEFGSKFGVKKTDNTYVYDDVLKAINNKITRAKDDKTAVDEAYSKYEEAKNSQINDEEIEELAKTLNEALKRLQGRYGPSNLSNEHSSIDLFYKVVKNNSFDGQESLVPYIRIYRRSTRYTYHYVLPTNSALSERLAGMSKKELEAETVNFYNPSNNDYDYSGLYDLMNPYYINSDLNAQNKDLWKGCPAPRGGSPLSTTKIYPKSDPFIEVGDTGSATYEIPFKVLVNKYLPKAQLLSSWYMLKDSSGKDGVAKLLNEIQEIYDYYCLSGEKEDGTAANIIKDYAILQRIRLKDPKTDEIIVDPENHVETRYIDPDTDLDEALLTNLYSFIVFERIELDFFSGGKIEFENSKHRAITDLVQSSNMDINFTIEYSYSYRTSKLNEDGTFTEKYSGTLHKKISGEDAKTMFKTELDKILNGSVPIVINNGDGEETVYIHPVSGMCILTPDKDFSSVIPLKFAGLNSVKNTEKNSNGYSVVEESGGYYYLTSSASTDLNAESDKKYNISDFDVNNIKNAIAEKLKELIREDFKSWRPDDLPSIRKLPKTQEEIDEILNDSRKSKEFITSVNYYGLSEPDFGSNNELITIDEGVATYVVEDVEFQVKQSLDVKTMPAYFPYEAHTWSRDIEFNNLMSEGASFKAENVSGVKLVATGFVKLGTVSFEVTSDSTWRVNMYSPLFTSVREKDFIAMLAEWETVADSGEFAADTYIRDLYSLIQFSKPEYEKGTNVSTVDTNNYIYINIPEEILYYDEDTSEFAFWMDHLQATIEDPIEPEENLKMRSRIPIMKWQQVDYSLYEECKDETTGKYKVYALWPEGSYMSKSLYAISANATNKSNDQIESWGGWKWNGTHEGLDIYGRRTTSLLSRAYASRIKTTYNGENIDFDIIQGSSYDIGNDGLENNGTTTTNDNSSTLNKLDNLLKQIQNVELDSSNIDVILNDYMQKAEDILNDDNSSYSSAEATKLYEKYNSVIATIEQTRDLYGGSDFGNLANVINGENNNSKNNNGTIHVQGLPKYDIYNSTSSATSIIMDNKTYTFDSSGAALYAYELYRLTKTSGNPDESSSSLTLRLIDESKNVPVVSIAPGIVTDVVAKPISGFKVVVTHTQDGSVSSKYIHLKRYPEVQIGEYVGAGTILGYEGTTGGSKGVHLHFELTTKDGGSSCYPIPYLYPFFTPFYKAEENGQKYTLEDEYLSLIRTVYPAGQKVGTDLIDKLGMNGDGTLNSRMPHFVPQRITAVQKAGASNGINQVAVDTDGTIKKMNYVPTLPIVDDYFELNTIANEKLKEYNTTKPEELNITGGIAFGGGHVKTFGIYFDKTFLDLVKTFSGYIFTGAINNPTPHIYDNQKPLFGDNGFNYSATTWKQLEMALLQEVVKAGYGSRAGVVAAARFLAGMDHSVPYLGKLTTQADVGIYSRRGLNATWGQRVYCAGRIISRNGFDCTGYVNWCLINGGVMPEGSDSYGSEESLGGELISTQTAIDTGRIKVGDVLQSRTYGVSGYTGDVGWNFTHTGILIGIANDKYYVAEESGGRLRITEYEREDFTQGNLNFVWVDKDENHPRYPAEGNMNKVTNERWYDSKGKYVATF